jgi:hypothetical protein
MTKSDHPPNHVEVAVLTTSGRWPATGFERTPSHQKVKVALDHAARELHLADTSGWVATVGGQEIAVESTYVDNHLTGQVIIDYGPRTGGGGEGA